jgi:hypothetical protein
MGHPCKCDLRAIAKERLSRKTEFSVDISTIPKGESNDLSGNGLRGLGGFRSLGWCDRARTLVE